MTPTSEQTEAELDAAYLPHDFPDDDCDAAYDAWKDEKED
jgi:hypothetical protein